MAVPPNRFASLSQIWLPAGLFVLSVVSILFTLRNDEDIPVIGPVERPTLDSSDLDSQRSMINQALQGSAHWRTYCEKPDEALASIRFAHLDANTTDSRWTELRRHFPQREQDALLRCQNAERRVDGTMRACLFLGSKDTHASLHLIELTLELREQGRKKVYSCAEALKAEMPLELAAWYTYSWSTETGKKPVRFERLTGGTRIFPPLAQNAERSTASSRP
jgi:hypothetical protein